MPPKRTRAAPRRASKHEEEEDSFDSMAEDSEEEIKYSDSEEDTGASKPRSSGRGPAARNVPRRSASKSISYIDQESEEEEEEEEDEQEAPQKKPKIEETGVFGLKWTVEANTMYVLTSEEIKPSSKIVGFDMDGTLIVPKGKGKFPKSREDWRWLYSEIPDKLKELHNNGFNIVIITNQAGIEKNKQNPADIKGKIADMSKELGFPIQALVSAATDVNRKPNTTMWDYFVKNMNGGVTPDTQVSLFVGDAGGRPKDWKQGVPKDFSTSDRAFAHNIGLPFKTPEEFFLGENEVPFEWDSIDPQKVLADLPKDVKLYTGDAPVVSDKQELIIFVGRPASGKSTFAKKHLVSAGYVHVNQDTLKTKDKCVKAAREALQSGKSVVVDNTNPSSQVRGEYIGVAKSLNVPVRCFVFQTDLELAHHLNFYREKVEGTRRVPDVGYNTFKSKYEEPTIEKEGYVEIKHINWVPDFASEHHKKLFLQRT